MLVLCSITTWVLHTKNQLKLKMNNQKLQLEFAFRPLSMSKQLGFANDEMNFSNHRSRVAAQWIKRMKVVISKKNWTL